jgi:hypothetical protein
MTPNNGHKFARPAAPKHVPSPLSPFTTLSTSPPPQSFFNVPKKPSTAFPKSHYYRAPRSTVSSPCRSNTSSPSTSPTRGSRQSSRIQALLATDPLLSRLTPGALREMANDPELGFSAEERAWSMRAAEGITKVGEWLKEVEGWNIAWGRGSKNGDGYLPPEPRRKRRKSALAPPAEEIWTVAELDDENTSPLKAKEQPESSRRAKPLTPVQLKLQRREAEKQELLKTPVAPVRRLSLAEDSEDEYEEVFDSEEYLGSLPRGTVEKYEARIEAITEGVEELDVEGLKGKVLCMFSQF